MMASTRAELKCNGEKASPCFRLSLTGKASDKYLSIRALNRLGMISD
jgi:hypothetical protein